MNGQQPKTPTSQLIFPNAEVTTQNQINNLMQIASLALASLRNPPNVGMFGQSEPQEQTDTMPPEAKIAAENLFIKATEALEAIIADKCRWSLDKQHALEKEFLESHALNKKFLEHQAQAAYYYTTPHFRFHPALARCVDGVTYAAFIGDPNDANNCIIGTGKSPEAALRAFDEVFEQGVPAIVAQYLERREQQIENGQTPEPYPKNNEQQTQQEQSKPVETERRENVNGPSRKRAKRPAARKGTRKNPQSGGTKDSGPGPTAFGGDYIS